MIPITKDKSSLYQVTFVELFPFEYICVFSEKSEIKSLLLWKWLWKLWGVIWVHNWLEELPFEEHLRKQLKFCRFFKVFKVQSCILLGLPYFHIIPPQGLRNGGIGEAWHRGNEHLGQTVEKPQGLSEKTSP